MDERTPLQAGLLVSDEAGGYARLMSHLASLPWTAIVTTGRTGSDYLQSLFDSHAELLVFNGILWFDKAFWQVSPATRRQPLVAADIIDSFVGLFLEKLKSRYDLGERKDRLGPDANGSLSLETQEFRAHALALLSGSEVTRHRCLLAVYGAYSLCLGRDLLKVRRGVHHVHHEDELRSFLSDVPDASVIVTTRDPRANFVSGVEHHRKAGADHARHVYGYLKRILEDTTPITPLASQVVAVRLEDLPHPDVMAAIAAWMGVSDNACLTLPTWGGLVWYGDSLSPELIPPSAWREGRTDNNWRTRLSWSDQRVLSFLMDDRLRVYEYPREPRAWWTPLLVLPLIFLPLRYERRFLTLSYLRQKIGSGRTSDLLEVAVTPFVIARRIALCLTYFRRSLLRQPFEGRWLRRRAPGRPA